MSARLGLLALMAVAPLALSCGGGSSFPEPAECVALSPAKASVRTPGTTSLNAYRQTIQDGVRRMGDYLDDFRGAYPSGNFSRKTEFRQDFAEYSDQTRCTAVHLRDVPPANPNFAERDATLDTALSALIAHTELGREAVKQRNVSEWRQWRDGVDVKLNAVRDAAGAIN